MASPGPQPDTSGRATEILRRDAQLVDDYLRDLVRSHWSVGAPPRLIEAIEYSLHAGGKRLRPTLVIECFHACCRFDARDPKPDDVRVVLPAAAAVELIHTFSLVHDDLPAMDDDDLRRGRPTNHKVFGEALAILAGDAMMTMAFELLAAEAPPPLVAPLVRELGQAAGPCGMIGGQVLDIEGEQKSLAFQELVMLHRQKTGALLTAACRMGAVCAGADDAALAAVTGFGTNLGLAFQIVDDLLDVTAMPEQVGKRTRKDASRGKNTYPALLGLDGSRAAANEQYTAALNALQSLGPAAVDLRTLATFVIQRDR